MRKKHLLFTAIAIAVMSGSILWAADHIDAPAVTNTPSDITDLYVFQGQDKNNLVFVANTQGLLSPTATSGAHFDPNTLIEFKIDNNGDNIEDLVIQAIYKNGKMHVYGPYKPLITGTKSVIDPSEFSAETSVTKYGEAEKIEGNKKGIKVFAGPRDDPFFFDLTQFKHIIAGEASSFNNPGTDAFAGTNVLSVVVEVPKNLLGGKDKLNVWLTTRKKTEITNYKN
ncbi:MAG: DUF4331 family protein [Bacteroidetes bacterium]|nr:DUF4331 family protein [Bacteroidota bacterium]